MHIEITYQQDGKSYTSSQQTYNNNVQQPLIFTFAYEQPEEPRIIESTAQLLPLIEEVEA